MLWLCRSLFNNHWVYVDRSLGTKFGCIYSTLVGTSVSLCSLSDRVTCVVLMRQNNVSLWSVVMICHVEVLIWCAATSVFLMWSRWRTNGWNPDSESGNYFAGGPCEETAVLLQQLQVQVLATICCASSLFCLFTNSKGHLRNQNKKTNRF